MNQDINLLEQSIVHHQMSRMTETGTAQPKQYINLSLYKYI